MKNRKISLLLFYILSFIYMEYLFRILAVGNVVSFSNIYMILFVLFYSMVMFIISKLFKEKGNKRMFFILLIITTVWFCAQYVVKTFFGFYISLAALGLADQVAGGFMGDAVIQVVQRIGGIIAFFIPLIVAIFIKKKLFFQHNKFIKTIVLCMVCALLFGTYLLSFQIKKSKQLSAYNLFYNINNLDANIETFGVLNTFYIDIYRNIFGFEERIEVVIDDNGNKAPKETVYGYNNLDIDLETLYNETKDSTIKSMTQYFLNEEGTQENQYTGFFKGKNLVFFMAETFHQIAVSEELTPTLYKLTHSGFVFKNFYTPTMASTLGGEMQELTGVLPERYGVFREGRTYFPMGIATLFKNIGYSAYAYHDNAYSFQDRHKYLKAMGFDYYLAQYNGLEKRMKFPWPASDNDMVSVTIDDYLNNDEPFLAYYATVSGHGDYTEGSRYYNIYKEILDEKLPGVSVEAKAYVAGQMELDKALETLINKLSEAGKLDDTVIALVGDHPPYYLYEKPNGMNYINELSSYERDRYIELFHSNFILWNSAMETVTVNKVGTQMDVMPTIYNLFDLDYDSRLIIGKDILSTHPGLSVLPSNCWVTEDGYYSNKKFTQTSDKELPDDYVDNMIQMVQTKKTLSAQILNKNYYKVAWEYLKTPKVDNNQTETESVN